MEIGLFVLSVVFALPILILAFERVLRQPNRVWEHKKVQPILRTVGPCVVAVGVYKTYEDRKQLEKMYSDGK
ncbi:MAG: hypothetical protein ACFFEW_13590 [Candidatus Thorarchaeota archaeon]